MKQYFSHRPPSHVTLLNDPFPRENTGKRLLTLRSRRKQFIRLLKALYRTETRRV